MAAPFVGNNDYRGYLNYLGSQGNVAARQLLNYVGNDAVFGGNANFIVKKALGTVNDTLYKDFQRLNAPAPAPPKKIASIYTGGGGGGGAPAPVYAPKLDIAAVNAQARAAAEGAVNPFYTKQLSDFLAKQAAQKQQRQQLYDTTVKDYEESLKNTLEGNEITKARTTEDVGRNLVQINQNEDDFQTDAGQEFDVARLDLARQASTGGLGAQRLEQATQARNTQEKRQTREFGQSREEQELFKTRSFDDLARSGKLATETTERGKRDAKFDLDTYIQNTAFEEQEKRNELEQQRLESIKAEQSNQARLIFNSYLAGISNPAQYAAAVATYGSSF